LPHRAPLNRAFGRRRFLASAGAFAAGTLASALPRTAAVAQAGLRLGPPQAYDYDRLLALARTIAASPYAAPAEVDPLVLERLDFDAMQRISFRPEFALWGGPDGYGVRLFHLHRYQKLPVRLFEVAGGQARELLYTPAAFDYGGSGLARQLPLDRLGWAGFRVLTAEQTSDWLAFQGASYFRSSGAMDQYGLSARGLAIDSGLETPEEFPRFSAFWLHRPAPGDETLLLEALLEGPSIAGAYRFRIARPGPVLMEVGCQLFSRREIRRLGIAPLTSMYWYDEADRRQGTDWRPEIHDSDGLALWTGAGERVWRPLNNPPAAVTNAFADRDPKGFGLLQRDRSFENYQDDGAFYDRRPSLWVEPLEPWGEGAVQLVELPTDDEIHDNIVAFWTPATPIKAGGSWGFAYRLHWLAEEPFPPASTARAVATRIGRGGIPGHPRPLGVLKFVIDFAGGGLEQLRQRFDVTPVIDASRGQVSNAYALKVVGTGRWRAAFDLEAGGEAPIDLRCFLRLEDEVLTETWLYQYLPALVR